MSLELFIDKWTIGDHPPTKVQHADLDAVEARLDFVFPQDYRAAILAHGLPWMTIALLHSIVETEADISDVSDFFEPDLIVEQTQAWREGGLPGHLVAFADAADELGELVVAEAHDRHDERHGQLRELGKV